MNLPLPLSRPPHSRLPFLGLACLALLVACSKTPSVSDAVKPAAAATPAASPATVAASAPSPSGAVAAHPADGIAWKKGDVDAAFAEAKAENKPVFLYWGAVWCPPCNQVKATIFNRQDFIERSRAFVAVYIDGDAPNAQQLGSRFKVSGYPSMLLFRPDGTELTRLPGEVDAQRYMQVLTMGMNGGRPVSETLKTALRGGAGLTENDWRMLAYYSWETDEQQLVPKDKLPETLTRLAKSCPKDLADPAERLTLESINLRATAKPKPIGTGGDAYGTLETVLSDPKRSRESFDILTDSVGATVRYATAQNAAGRPTLIADWDRMLEKSASDTTLSQADRLGAVDARVELARVNQPKGPLPPTLLDFVRKETARADHETTDAYERQSVINAAASTLADAGLLDESDALLKNELTRSHSPYYFMVDLAHNAKTRGDKAAAIDWLARAYDASEGPATRLQWGVIYLRGLVELAPNDEARIESVSESVISQLNGNSDLLYERNRASLAHLGKKLDEWNKTHQHDAALARIRAKLDPVCTGATQDATLRSRCLRLFNEPGDTV
ncbi:MAG: thioredoxin fold domain-containing protein [Burkholderiaceae bacterium]